MRKFTLIGLLFACGLCANAATPTLSANATQSCYAGTIKPFLTIVSGSGKTSYVSGVINDPTDPAATQGILFTTTNGPIIKWDVTSSSTSVVPVANVVVTPVSGSTTDFIIKITPRAVGTTKITIKANNGSASTAYNIQYVASAAVNFTGIGNRPTQTIFPTLAADASAAVAIDDDYMVVAEDETDRLLLYSRKSSGQALSSIGVTGKINCSEESDVEGATMSTASYGGGKRIYWIGSLGNNKSGAPKPDRNRVFATDITGSGATTTLAVKGYYKTMREKLISWGDNQSWNFTASARAALSGGMIPKRIDGFNVEGLVVTHEGNKAYIGFRAPCVPAAGTTPSSSNRKYAVLAPVNNFEAMMNTSSNTEVTTAPVFGNPILFNLGNTQNGPLGIRDITRVGTNKYIIIAGYFDGGGTPAIYLWDGVVPANSNTVPISEGTSLIKLPLDLSDVVQATTDGALEGHPEAVFAEQESNKLIINLICDNGTVVYYNDGVAAKDLAADSNKAPWSKFRMDTYEYTLTTTGIADAKKVSSISYGVANDILTLSQLSAGSVISIFRTNGQLISSGISTTEFSANLPEKGMFVINITGAQGNQTLKIFNK